jgi:hypothetical protein
MLVLRLLRLMVAGLATVHALGVVLHRPLVPWSGTLTMAALLAYAWLALSRPVRWDAARTGGGRSWPDRALLVGLAALTVEAWLVDNHNGGFGWPLAAGRLAGGLTGGVEAALLSGAAIGVAGAVIATMGRPRSRRWRIGTAVAAVMAAAVAVVPVWINLTADRVPWRPAPDPTELVLAVLPFAVAAVLVVVAAALVAAARMRLTAAVLVPLAGLALLAGSQAAVSTRTHAEAAIPVERNSVLLRPGLVYARDDQVTAGVAVAYAIQRQPPGDPQLPPGSADTPSQLADLWPRDFWTAELSWEQAVPALTVMLYLLGLLAAVTVVLPVEAPDNPVRDGF